MVLLMWCVAPFQQRRAVEPQRDRMPRLWPKGVRAAEAHRSASTAAAAKRAPAVAGLFGCVTVTASVAAAADHVLDPERHAL